MCMKNINAIGVIILFLSAFIGGGHGGKRKLKHAKSVSYETDDTSSDSEEYKRPYIKHLAAKVLLNSEDTEESCTDEKIIGDGHKNKNRTHKHFSKKHYLNLRNGKESSKEDEVIRGNSNKNMNEDVAPNLKNLEPKTIWNQKDDIEFNQDEKIIRGNIKSNPNDDVVHIHEVSEAITHMNSADPKKSSTEDEVIRGNPKIKFYERVPSKYKDFAERTALNLEDTKESFREDGILRGDTKSKFNVPSKHEDLAAETRFNLEDTNESIRDYKIVRGNPNIQFNERVPSKHKDLTEGTDVNLENTKEDEIVRGDINSKLNERVPLTHEGLASEARLNLEDTQEPIKKYEIKSGATKIQFNVPSKHKDLAEKTDLNLEDTKELIREDEIDKVDAQNVHIAPKQTFLATGTNLISHDAIELSGKDKIVQGNGENPFLEEKVLTIHLTSEKSDQNKDHKPILRQWTPPPVIIRAQEKLNLKNPASNESSSEDDGAMERDIKKVKALRKAYGDACARVVVRKCLKAMKSTLNKICKTGGRKCNSEFSDELKKNSIAGCYMQFSNKSTSRLGNEGSMETEAQLGDYTRTLSMTCLRTLSDTAEESESAVKSTIVDAQNKNVNILRDKYEKACQKESYGKCCAAGKYANDTTCNKYDCTTIKKKAIKRTYKKYCGDYYGYVKPGSSSSSSSGSGSGSGSSASSN